MTQLYKKIKNIDLAFYKIPKNFTEEVAINKLQCTYAEFRRGWMQASVEHIKECIEKYGGSGRIEHYDKDGYISGITPIE